MRVTFCVAGAVLREVLSCHLLRPAGANEVSYVMSSKRASLSAWQVQYLVKFWCHFSWQAQYLVKFKCHFSWHGEVLREVVVLLFVAGAALGEGLRM